MTQLMLERRAEADAQFRPFRRAVLGVDRNKLRRLHGRVVYVAFDTPDGRPPKGEGHVKQLVDALESYSPLDFDFANLPDPAPPGIVTRFSDGILTSARLSSETGSPFSRLAGWDLVFAQPATIRQKDVWTRFCDLISEHDRPGVDETVVSAQAPTAAGIAYPSDGAAAQAVIAEAHSKPTVTQFIRRIYIHIWSTRCIFALTPGRVGAMQICGELPLHLDRP